MTRIFALVFMAVTMGLASPAAAQDKLQFENLVRKHFDTVMGLYSVEKIDHEKIVDYTESYVDEGYIYKSSTTSNLSEKPITAELSKTEFMKNLRDSSKQLLDAKSKYTIISIKISEDGTKADVHFNSLLSGTGQMTMKNVGLVNIAIQSLSDCVESFKYVDENTIKGTGSDCQIEAIYQKPVPVK